VSITPLRSRVVPLEYGSATTSSSTDPIYPGAWNKLVVVAREDDHEAMLDHALIQSRRRYRT
jgi:hypothetical protein